MSWASCNYGLRLSTKIILVRKQSQKMATSKGALNTSSFDGDFFIIVSSAVLWQSKQSSRPTGCWYRYWPAASSSATLYGTCHTWRMLILLPLSVALRLLVCQLSGINSISISFDYFQCQYSISFTCSTERGRVRDRLTACVCRCQCQCQFCQFSFCQLSFVSSQ